MYVCSYSLKVKLIDFGCAFVWKEKKTDFGGTSIYMAPEVSESKCLAILRPVITVKKRSPFCNSKETCRNSPSLPAWKAYFCL